MPPGCRQHTGLAHVLGLRPASPSPCRVSAHPGYDRWRGGVGSELFAQHTEKQVFSNGSGIAMRGLRWKSLYSEELEKRIKCAFKTAFKTGLARQRSLFHQ